MNARSIVVGFVLSLSLSLACDEECPHPDRSYLPCDDECDLGRDDPNGREYCLRGENSGEMIEVCAQRCREDSECSDVERMGKVYPGACNTGAGGLCTLPCVDTSACPPGMGCKDTLWGNICAWEYAD